MEARVLKKVTFGVLNLKIKMTKRSLTVLLLKKLQRRRLGTNDVENFCSNIQRKYAKSKMRSSMMSIPRTEDQEFVYIKEELSCPEVGIQQSIFYFSFQYSYARRGCICLEHRKESA